jgi:putative oxidoreductase
MVPSGKMSAMVNAGARLVMGVCFLVFGLDKLWDINGTTAFVGSKLPFAPFVFWLAVVIEAGSGALMIIGYKTRWVALFLTFYCGFLAVLFHTNFAEPHVIDHFFSNIMMIAAFLYLFANGPGAMALENRHAGH